jgi:hypothetical protein
LNYSNDKEQLGKCSHTHQEERSAESDFFAKVFYRLFTAELETVDFVADRKLLSFSISWVHLSDMGSQTSCAYYLTL